MVAHGFQYTSYSCAGWGSSFGITYPILNGDADNTAWNLFGTGSIPHNVVLDHNMEVVYTSAGFNQAAILAAINAAVENVPMDADGDDINDPIDNCPVDYNPSQVDIDLDGLGDACDNCDNANVWVRGNIDGNVDENGNFIFDIMDILSLVDVVIENNQESCAYQAANMNGDNNVNIIDVITLVQMLLGGNNPQSTSALSNGTFNILQSENGNIAKIESIDEISGFQFEIDNTDLTVTDLNQILLPEGWSLKIAKNGNKIIIIGYDMTGKNSRQKIEFNVSGLTVDDFTNTVVASANAGEIRVNFSESKELVEGVMPNSLQLQRLYPNPFNPELTISFALPKEAVTQVTVYNTVGKEVDIVQSKKVLEAGSHTLFWDATDQPTGMYFIRVQTGAQVATKKALLVK